MTEPIRNDMKYITEMFQTDNVFDPRSAIANDVFSRKYNIYSFSIAEHITDPANYWIAWGGYFDNPTGFGIQIFLNRFLAEVFTTANLKIVENSFYIDTVNFIVYMNIPLPPWLYFRSVSALYNNSDSTFSTATRDPLNPSDIYYGNVKAEPRMEIPTLNNKLNDIVSGINVYNSYNVVVANQDGKYDGFDIIDFFNTPIQISKTSEDAQTIEEFNRIRFGFVYDLKVRFDSMTISAVDRFFLMDRDFCQKFTLNAYPNLPSGNINKDIPVGWGPLIKTPTFEVNKDTSDPSLWADYIALDSNYIESVSAVYSDDGQSLTYSFDSETGIIRVTSLDDEGEVIESGSADVTGFSENSIGEIIIKALADNENIPYLDGVWDVTETDKYLGICSDVGLYFSGGTTKDLIDETLKNDIAFLIQKNNGLLTLRQWGQEYTQHTIPGWTATQEPEKGFADASKFYCSTSKILYNKNQASGNFELTYINDSRERLIFQKHKRSYTAPFETDLLTSQDAEDLSSRILDRFGNVRETFNIGFGVDTFEIDLLDTVRYEGVINDRDFSDYSTWVVKAADPGQDVLTMEGLNVGTILTFDDIDAEIDDALFETT